MSCVQREGHRGGIFLEQLAGKALQELGQCAIIIVRSCNERLTDSEGEAATFCCAASFLSFLRCPLPLGGGDAEGEELVHAG